MPRPGGSPECTAGPKIAHFDRIEWTAIPDVATAAAALQQGQVDWWQEPSLDLTPTLKRDTALTVETLDPSGLPGMLRFNHLQPPFNNPAIRRALLGAVNQSDYMQAVAGEDRSLWRDGAGYFAALSRWPTTPAWRPSPASGTWRGSRRTSPLPATTASARWCWSPPTSRRWPPWARSARTC